MPRVGDTLDPLDLDIATRLLSLAPADVGSNAARLRVVIDEHEGWTLGPAQGDGWVAIFGLYTSELRRPDLIPEQVRVLRSLLAGTGEAHIRRIRLADANGGTYTWQ